MLLGYGRVSTQEQNLDRQIDQLEEAGCERIFLEKISGAKSKRQELENLLDHLRTGDTVVVVELTRLSRSVRDLINIVEEIRSNGADIKSLKESWLDTTTAHGRLMFTFIAGLSQFERDLTVERTKEGLKAARARGRVGGRPKKDNKALEKAFKLYNSKEFSGKEIEEQTGVSRSTLYRYINNQKG